ncbi:MAG TPA: iron ABC transporter permease [Chloroflexota bacterium]|nr:iron ABC transporter permease [Chloroflexota bacterium]
MLVSTARKVPRAAVLTAAWPLVRDPALGLIGALVVLALAGVLTPLLLTAWASLREGLLVDAGPLVLSNYVAVLADPLFPSVLANTLLLGLGSVAVMLFFAVPIVWLLARTDLPGKGLVFTLLTVKIAIPGFLTAMAYVFLLSPRSGIVNTALQSLFGLPEPPFTVYSLPWIAALQGLVLVPAASFMLLAAFQAMDPALEEVAAVSGMRRLQVWLRITLPMLAPALLATAVFFFVIAIELFDFAGLIGLPVRIIVLSTWIYDLTHPAVGLPNYGQASALGVILGVLAAIGIGSYLLLIRRAERFVTVTGKRRQAAPIPLGRWRWAAFGFLGLYFLLAFLLPLLTLLWASLLPYLQPPSPAALSRLTLESYGFALRFLPVPLRNTLLVMLVVATLSVLLSACVSWVVLRTQAPGRRLIDGVIFLSPAIPGMLSAVAFLYLGLSVHKLVPLYGTIWLILLAMSTRTLAFSTRTINSAAIQLHRELEEAAQVAGVRRSAAFLRLFVPLVAPALFYAWLWIAVLSARELTIPLMLYARDNPLLSTLIWNTQASGKSDVAAALAVLLMSFLGLFALVAQLLARRHARGAELTVG